MLAMGASERGRVIHYLNQNFQKNKKGKKL
jgi:hypothetical protein